VRRREWVRKKSGGGTVQVGIWIVERGGELRVDGGCRVKNKLR
jgi:hypothetical protein